MIAVFTQTGHYFRTLQLFPRNKFVRVKDVNSIRGIRFDAVIIDYIPIWNKDHDKAYEALLHRQPELFKG